MHRNDHIALILPDSLVGDPKPAAGRRSWFRLWKQCTRLQRSIALLAAFAVVSATALTILHAGSWWPAPPLPASGGAVVPPAHHQLIDNNGDFVGGDAGIVGVGRIQIAPIRLAAGAGEAPAVRVPPVVERLMLQPPPPPKEQQQLVHPPPAVADAQSAAAAAAPVPDDRSQPGAGDGFGVPPPPQPALQPDDTAANDVAADLPLLPHKPSVDRQPAATDNEPVHFAGPTNERQRAAVRAFRHAWAGYKEYAWGHDNLKPVSMMPHDWFGLGLTIVDSLDTMWIMNLREEFDEARDWIDQHLSFDVNRDINLFEVTIRVLGGLLSAYHLSGDRMFLAKATDLGDRLLPCFDSPSGVPFSDINLATRQAHSPKWSPDSSTSEVTTVQLEFRDLARATGRPEFAAAVDRINAVVHALPKRDGLVPIFINANTGTFRAFATVSLGARGDSYYEYLLKQWLQAGQREEDESLIADYRTAIAGVQTHLVRRTPTDRHLYVGELINGKDFKPKMDHLTCYLPGTLLLGHQHAAQPADHRQLADALLDTCHHTYAAQPTRLAAEITYFTLPGEQTADMYVKSNDAHNLLRPEFVESLYYYWALTGNRTAQDWGWQVLEAMERHSRVKAGYTSLGNVKNAANTRPWDMMESFFLGETLKYFYLLFADNRREVDLERFVFNSEAHLVPVWGREGK